MQWNRVLHSGLSVQVHCVVEKDKARFVGHFAQIIELYDESANKTMMLKSKRNMGIASFWLLDEIQDQE